MSDPIVLPPLCAPVDQLWAVLLDLADRLRDVPWSLIGGQMVLLHALERGTEPPQVSQDGDIIANVRLATSGLARILAGLQALGFDCDGTAPGGIATATAGGAATRSARSSSTSSHPKASASERT
jgi:hypothetical protein